MGISRGENGAPSRISTRRHTHRHRDRGVARHPSRIGEISVSARNPPLLFPRVPLAGFCSSYSSSSSCAALPPLFTPRNPRRACHARCIVVLSGAISLSVSQGHRNPWCALTCPPTSRTSRTTPQKRVHVSRHALRLLDFKNLVHPSSRKAFLFFCVHPQSARTVTSLTFLFFPPPFIPFFTVDCFPASSMIVLADAPLYPYPSTSFFFILLLSHLSFYLLVRISVFFGRLYLFF